MKALLRIAAGLSFSFCLLAGLALLIPALSSPKSDGFMLVAVGLLFAGFGVFFGAILLVAANRRVAKE
jgi:hypothetical protein